MRFSRTTAVLAAASPFVAAQTSTDCDPTKKTCPSDTGLNAASFAADFTQGSSANASFSAAAYTFIDYNSLGAEFTISKEGQAPTVQTDFYIFFGRIDVKMRAAPGTGIVSSIVFESDDLDEIDWEFLGGNTAQVETNFFGKGNTTVYDRAIYYQVSNPQTEFHTYTLDWNSDRIQWIIDGTVVRTLAYTDPLTNGGQNFPQTPMRLKLGNWCGGCSGEPEGTIEWAGGNTTFGNAPYTMYVESITIQNYNPADSYEYGDMSGSWESIKINGGESPNSTGSTSAAAATGSAVATSTGGVYLSGNGTMIAAPTSSASVAGIDQQTVAVVSITQTGSSYSMNTASASAQNDESAAATGSNSVVTATTEVPGPSPTDGSDSGSSSSTGTAATGSSASSTSTGPSTQTGSSTASVNNVLRAGSLLSVALGFLML